MNDISQIIEKNDSIGISKNVKKSTAVLLLAASVFVGGCLPHKSNEMGNNPIESNTKTNEQFRKPDDIPVEITTRKVELKYNKDINNFYTLPNDKFEYPNPIVEFSKIEFPKDSYLAVSKPVAFIDDSIYSAIDKMTNYMHWEKAVSFCAPQVGFDKRIIVLDDGDKSIVLINPEIMAQSKEKIILVERCSGVNLSLAIERPKKVIVKAFNENGDQFIKEYDGTQARAILHNMDHLNGLYFQEFEKGVVAVAYRENGYYDDIQTDYKTGYKKYHPPYTAEDMLNDNPDYVNKYGKYTLPKIKY